jgi:hypothetical protein
VRISFVVRLALAALLSAAFACRQDSRHQLRRDLDWNLDLRTRQPILKQNPHAATVWYEARLAKPCMPSPVRIRWAVATVGAKRYLSYLQGSVTDRSSAGIDIESVEPTFETSDSSEQSATLVLTWDGVPGKSFLFHDWYHLRANGACEFWTRTVD